jgi:hypothetical protein
VVSAGITSGAQANEANPRGRSFSAAAATGSPKDEGPRNASRCELAPGGPTPAVPPCVYVICDIAYVNCAGTGEAARLASRPYQDASLLCGREN